MCDPHSWEADAELEEATAARGCRVAAASPVPPYLRAPYLINVASANTWVPIPARKIL